PKNTKQQKGENGLFNNPFEKHLSSWSKKDFRKVGKACGKKTLFFKNQISLIVLFSPDKTSHLKFNYSWRLFRNWLGKIKMRMMKK
ncbi:MAG: hypothetical protein ACTSPO_16000, partial [Candidatus Heimdallarchaeaceae archaeon]